MQSKFIVAASLLVVFLGASGWVGVEDPHKRQGAQSLSNDGGGVFTDLPENERKELVWMAKAANAAYPGVSKPLRYRSFSRQEWDACASGCDEIVYTADGYFNVGSGLRGRLMVHMLDEGRVILALSGCDFGLNTVGEGTQDVWHCIKQYFTCTSRQYEQALKVMNGVLSSKCRSEFWIVGHSLGGSLTTYLALHLPEARTKVKCATFNGYGLSPFLDKEEGSVKLAERRLRNVYAEGDPVYRIKGVRHLGPSYSLECKGDWLTQHSIDNLVKLMIAKRSRWAGL
ncbi:MAG: alpha/beta hydrolase [Kiritimatiellae bacterium]|nr:alpha/beta hydrolase [Kiritimatiellia bacterium]